MGKAWPQPSCCRYPERDAERGQFPASPTDPRVRAGVRVKWVGRAKAMNAKQIGLLGLLAFGMIGIGAAIGRSERSFDSLKVRSLFLEDAEGRTRAVFATIDDTTAFTLLDASGTARLSLAVIAEGDDSRSVIYLSDRDGTKRIQLSVSDELLGVPMMTMTGPRAYGSQKGAMEYLLMGSHASSDNEGNEIITEPALALFDQNGKPTLKLP